MKARTLQLSLLAATLLALGAATTPARADDARAEWRSDSREIRQDKRELRGDYRELAEDRADYARARAAGDYGAMRRERMEIRQDMREIGRDRAELRRDLRDRQQDRSDHWRGQNSGNRYGNWQGSQPSRWTQHTEQRGETRADWRHDAQARPAAWHPAAAASNNTAASNSGNNGRQLGWQQGRGNRHGG